MDSANYCLALLIASTRSKAHSSGESSGPILKLDDYAITEALENHTTHEHTDGEGSVPVW